VRKKNVSTALASFLKGKFCKRKFDIERVMATRKVTEFKKKQTKTINKQSIPECLDPEEEKEEEASLTPHSSYRPPKTFIFPQRIIGGRYRSCHHHWFDTFPWLHYDTRY
jgi:hypothetical protein